jgi:hypothetical protein
MSLICTVLLGTAILLEPAESKYFILNYYPQQPWAGVSLGVGCFGIHSSMPLFSLCAFNRGRWKLEVGRVFHMRLTLIATVLVFAVTSSGQTRQPSDSATPTVQYTRSQLNQLVRDAHTQEQYETLAKYYRGKQMSYSAEATEEKQEWVRRSQNVVLTNAKYPRPVDSARYLYEYYADQAERDGQLATNYERLVVVATPAVTK